MTKLLRFLAHVLGFNRKTIRDLSLNLRIVGILILSVLCLVGLTWALMGFSTELVPIESY